jgi:DTW domain-containing protein
VSAARRPVLVLDGPPGIELDAPAPAKAVRSRRLPRCAGCGLAETLCFCASLAPMAVRTRVVVVAHRDELYKTTNTGRLVPRLLEGARFLVRGEHADPTRDLERESAREAAELFAPETRRLVLFPAPGARLLSASDLAEGPLALVVPDGTWTQGRKLGQRDPLALGAERVALPPGPPSRYRLRRNGREGGLCTLEAVARAMRVLEGPEVEARMLEVLDRFVACQLVTRGRGVAPDRAHTASPRPTTGL